MKFGSLQVAAAILAAAVLVFAPGASFGQQSQNSLNSTWQFELAKDEAAAQNLTEFPSASPVRSATQLAYRSFLIYLDACTPGWKLDEQPNRAVIHTRFSCSIDAKDRFTASYDYRIDATGELSIHYSTVPEVQVKWIPPGRALD